MSTIVRGTDYKVVFIEGWGEEGAKAQEAKIAELDKDGWEWAGFISTSRTRDVRDPGDDSKIIGAATETAGVFFYFKRVRTDLQTVSPGEAAMLRPHGSRALRRQAAREAVRVGRRVN